MKFRLQSCKKLISQNMHINLLLKNNEIYLYCTLKLIMQMEKKCFLLHVIVYMICVVVSNYLKDTT